MKNLNKQNFNRFNKSAITLAVPIMFQNLLYNGVTFLDTLMIGQLGEASIAAVGVASQLFFLIILFLFGVSSGSAIFIAQYWGAKDRKGVQRVMGVGLILAVIVTTIVALLSTIYPTLLMNLFSKDPLVVQQGNSYLRIVGISYVLTAISFLWAVGFRSIGDAKTPLFISLISVSVNAIGNYLLIFGIGIFPELGVTGAAISTTFSRILEVVLYIIVSHVKKDCPLKFNFHDFFDFDRAFLKKFFKTCAPVIINEVFWSLGITCYKIAYSKIGTEALAAVQVIEAINNLFFVASAGLANATAIIIGMKIGQGEEEEAKLYAKLSLFLSMFIGIIVTVLIILVSPRFLDFFNIGETVKTLALHSIYVIALLATVKSIDMNIIVGILRSGGDTKFSMYLEMGSVWLVGVPLAFLGVMYLNLSLPLIYALVGCEEITKCTIGLSRIKSGKWYNNLTELI